MLFGLVDWSSDIDLSPFADTGNSGVCKAKVASPQPNTSTYRFRSTPYGDANILASLTEGTDIDILGTNGTWYYAEYNEMNGWIIAYGVVKTDASCIPPLASYNPQTGEVDFPNIVYDYELEFPKPSWYTANDWDTKSMEEKFSIWRTEGAIYLWDRDYSNLYGDEDGDEILNYREPDFDNDNDGTPNKDDSDDDNDGLPDVEELYTCTGDDDATSRQNCTLLNFVVFYELFYRIYGPERPLMVSDILAVTYPLELAAASVFDADMAKQTLGTYYFYQVRDYCKREIVPASDDTCDEETLQMPIEHFVHRYTYTNDIGSQVISDGFLPPLNAWYHQATLIAKWYFGTPTVDLSLVTSLESILKVTSDLGLLRLPTLGAARLTNLLAPTDLNNNLQTITMTRLTLSVPRPTFSNLISSSGPITWGNFPYPGPSPENDGTDFWLAVRAPMPPPNLDSNVKICVLNQTFNNGLTPDVNDDDSWRLDAFAIVIDNGNTGFGTTPPWGGSPNSRTFGTNKSCLCSPTSVITGCP